MRVCIRCNTAMIENLEIKTNDAMGVCIGEKGIFKGSFGKLAAAVCPECGYVETYIADTEKMKRSLKM